MGPELAEQVGARTTDLAPLAGACWPHLAMAGDEFGELWPHQLPTPEGCLFREARLGGDLLAARVLAWQSWRRAARSVRMKDTWSGSMPAWRALVWS